MTSLDDLSAGLPAGSLRVDPEVVLGYASDTADLVQAGTACAVVTARTVEDVQHVMRWASAARVPVIPRGAGTGLSGGATAVDGALVLDLSRMDRVLEIDPSNRLAVVEPGVVNAALSLAAQEHGLMFAPDPSSWETSTIGGNIATNAGGLRCVRYGATRAAVLGLDVVLADGRLLHTGGRTAKRSAGYDLTGLFVGSEGTLGVVVGATVRLQAVPPPQVTALLTFGAARDAAAAAAAIVVSGAPPTLLELMDETTVRAVDAYRGTGFGPGVRAVLIAQVDEVPGAADLLEAAALAHGATDVALTTDLAEARELLDIRRSALPAKQQLGRTLVEDVCVPVSRLADLIEQVEQISRETGVVVSCVAHAGDGNAHPVLIVPEAADGEAQVWAAADRIFTAALELGGTVSGEHGIGRLKRRWLADEVGDTSLEVQRGIKAAFDPLGILNPGAVL
ncbi:MAG: glycolate oxidase [Frankiales bacterium]|jgi:glycolate oxidase|nr:glycolate oxidase [Frankiales bacterium]